MSKWPKAKPGIMNIKPYVQGSAKAGNAKKVIKLSSNENPLGPSPKAITAYKNYTKLLNLYNDGSVPELRDAIAKENKIPAGQIVCGSGSDELIALITQAYSGVGDEVIFTEHGFLMYPISAMRVGAHPVKVPEKNLRTDVNSILKGVTDKTKIVFIANPNNPTGSYISRDELVYLRKNLRADILLIIDGAYAEYVSKKDYTAGIDIVDMGENTVMLRTFSKIYGMAALRLGWAYCPPSIADVLNRVRGPFNVSGPAQAAGIAAIKDRVWTKKSISHNNKWLKIVSAELKQMGLTPHPSVANFVLVEFPSKNKTAAAADEFLRKNGVIGRRMESYGLPSCLRFTIGLESENKKLLQLLKKFLST